MVRGGDRERETERWEFVGSRQERRCSFGCVHSPEFQLLYTASVSVSVAVFTVVMTHSSILSIITIIIWKKTPLLIKLDYCGS